MSDSPLHVAAQAGDEHEVARLVAEGADIDAGNYRAYTPLHVAAGRARSGVVAVLLDAGADASARSTFLTTPLHQLAGGGFGAAEDAPVEIIDRLLAAGCPIDAVDSSGRTALWYAAATGTAPWTAGYEAVHHRVLRALLDRGADADLAANGRQGRPADAARGLHQDRKYRIEWTEGVAMLEARARR